MSNEHVQKAIKKIRKEASINESYLIGLLWSNPTMSFPDFHDVFDSSTFVHEVWGFYFQLGSRMYQDSVKKFDIITTKMKVKEYNLESEFEEYGGYDTVKEVINIVEQHSENIDYYAEKIRRTATIRELIALFGSKILAKRGNYDWSKMDGDELLTYWQDKINTISLKHGGQKHSAANLYVSGEEYRKQLQEDVEEMLEFYKSYHWTKITKGIARGHVYMFGGFGNSGKALSVDTVLPTPNGWSTIGEIEVGDMVFGRDGKSTRVLWKSPVYTDHDVYRITFSDGSILYADAEHQWSVKTDLSVKQQRKGCSHVVGRELLGDGYYTVTTAEMVEDHVKPRKDGKGNVYKYSVPMHEAIEYSEKNLLIDPYLFGLWLGDGYKHAPMLSIFEDDVNEIVSHIESLGYSVEVIDGSDGRRSKKIRIANGNRKGMNELRLALKELGVLENRHIPRIYLEGSIEQRMALLQGLMDSDGSVQDKTGACEWSQKDERLTGEFCELLASLGFRYAKNARQTTCQTGTFDSFRVHFFSSLKNPVFKLARYIEKLPVRPSSRQRRKAIHSIELVESMPVQCLAVDNADNLFLVGKEMTVTHNSSIMVEKVLMSMVSNGEKCIVILNEEDEMSIRQKVILSIINHEFRDENGKSPRIKRQNIVENTLTEEEAGLIDKAFERMKELMEGDEAKIKIIFMERYSMKELLKIVRFWNNRGYDNLIIDTHKVSDDSPHRVRWETFVEDTKDIYRITRKAAGGLNLRTFINFQLADHTLSHRYLDFLAMGEGKAAKNEASVVQMFRAAWADEYEGGSHEITCWKRVKNKATGEYETKTFPLKKGETYYLLFTPKNRFGQNQDAGQPVLVLNPKFEYNAFPFYGYTMIKKEYR